MGLRIINTSKLDFLVGRIETLDDLVDAQQAHIDLLEEQSIVLNSMCNELKSDGTEYFLEQKILQLEATVRVCQKRLSSTLKMKIWVAFNKAEMEEVDDEK